jgi:hypothetical protein
MTVSQNFITTLLKAIIFQCSHHLHRHFPSTFKHEHIFLPDNIALHPVQPLAHAVLPCLAIGVMASLQDFIHKSKPVII